MITSEQGPCLLILKCNCLGKVIMSFITSFYIEGGGGVVAVQSVPITTKIVSSNPVHSEVYSIQHYVIKFFSDLR
jgi:hypothetical protein